MLIRKPSDVPASEITPQESYTQFLSRRRFLRNAIAGGITSGAVLAGADRLADVFSPPPMPWPTKPGCRPSRARSPRPASNSPALQDITHYNNFYEFGVQKERARGERRWPAHASVDREGGRQGETAENLRHRRAAETASARRPRLSPSLRRGLEHGDPLGRLLAL